MGKIDGILDHFMEHMYVLQLISEVEYKKLSCEREIVADFLQKSQKSSWKLWNEEGEYILSTVFAIFCMNILDLPDFKYSKAKAKEFC